MTVVGGAGGSDGGAVTGGSGIARDGSEAPEVSKETRSRAVAPKNKVYGGSSSAEAVRLIQTITLSWTAI